jgi:hypothetical protein
MFSKITSEFHEVIKRILIVLSVIIFLSITILNIIDGQWFPGGFIISGLYFIAYWIIVSVINWILKGANK